MPVGELQEVAVLLENTRWGKDFTWKELQALSGYMRLNRYKDGATITQEGAKELSLLIIGKGSVEVIKHDSSYQPKVLTRMAAGQTVGEIALIDGQPRSASLQAVQEVEMIELTQAGFEKLCEENPRLAVKVTLRLARLLSARLRATTGALSEQL